MMQWEMLLSPCKHCCNTSRKALPPLSFLSVPPQGSLSLLFSPPFRGGKGLDQQQQTHKEHAQGIEIQPQVPQVWAGGRG